MPKRKDGKYIQVCPKCKSPDVGSDAANQLQSIGAPAMLVCNACGHAGPVFPEVAVAEIEEIRKMPAESQASKERPPLVDISYGKFIAKGQWKIEAPLVIVLSIFGLYIGFWPSIVFLLMGLWMIYVAYFKK